MTLLRRPLPPVLLCAVLWGSAFPGIKQVYQHWKDEGVVIVLPMIFFFAGVRFCLAGGGLLIAGKHLRKELKETSWKLLLPLALTQTFIQYVCFYNAVNVASASLAALLVATGSFWWMILAPILQKSPWPNVKQWLALCIGGLGVTLAVYAPGAGVGNPMLGAVLMLTATCSGAVAVIIFQKVKPTMSAVNATGISLLTGGVGLLALGVQAFSQAGLLFDTRVIVSTLWLSFVSAAAFSLWNHLTTLFPVTLLASYRFLIPICGVIEALIFLKAESPGWGLFTGGALVILSVLMAQRSTRVV